MSGQSGGGRKETIAVSFNELFGFWLYRSRCKRIDLMDGAFWFK